MSAATAAYQIVVAPAGADVVYTGSGSLDTTGMTLVLNDISCGPQPQTIASLPMICLGAGMTGLRADVVTAFPVLGPGVFAEADSSAGPPVFVTTASLFLPAGYVSGSPLGNSARFNGQTLASMGLTVGTYGVTLSNGEVITIYVGTSPPVVSPVAPVGVPVGGWGAASAVVLCMLALAWRDRFRGRGVC